jgi:hypothetical protein
MATLERRQFPRVDSSNNLSFAYLDKNNKILDHATGRTINISEGGFLFVSDLEMKEDCGLIATIEVPDGEVQLLGQIIHCQPLGNDKYIAGVLIKDIFNNGEPLWKSFINRLLEKD